MCVYIVLGVLYESYVHPLTILSTLPSAGVGALLALRREREVDHHDRVLLDDADEQHDADDGDDVEALPREHQGEQRADARRRW